MELQLGHVVESTDSKRGSAGMAGNVGGCRAESIAVNIVGEAAEDAVVNVAGDIVEDCTNSNGCYAAAGVAAADQTSLNLNNNCFRNSRSTGNSRSFEHWENCALERSFRPRNY